MKPSNTRLPRLARWVLRGAAIGGATVLLALCLGCATPVERHFGEAYRSAALAQTIDPQAGQTSAGPLGLDARTAELVEETYEKNQRKEKSDPKQIFLIHQ